MAELVDARDLKSLGACLCAGSIPAPGTFFITTLPVKFFLFFADSSKEAQLKTAGIKRLDDEIIFDRQGGKNGSST